MGNINLSSIKSKVLASKKMEEAADNFIKKKLQESKAVFIENFDNHPVTQELEGKESSTNLSNTLNGKGNLFTFIGFPKGSEPIEDLRNLIMNQFSYKRNKDTKAIKYSISYPSLDKIKKSTPMPWENGRSWVEGIEKGISGLSYYLFKKSISSRSGGGLQSKNEISAASFKRIKFLSEIIEKFKKDINKK
jgi:hypothetical protein